MRLMFLIAMYWISGFELIKETKGWDNFLQIDLIFSASVMKSMYQTRTLAADKTTAALLWLKWGTTHYIAYSMSLTSLGKLVAMKSNM